MNPDRQNLARVVDLICQPSLVQNELNVGKSFFLDRILTRFGEIENFGRIWSPEFLNSGDMKSQIFRDVNGPKCPFTARISRTSGPFTDLNFENFG